MAPFEAQDTRFMVFDQALAPQNYLTNAIEKSPENSSTSNSWSPRSTNELYELSIPTQQSDLQFGTFLSCKDTCSQPMGTSYEILPKKRFYGKSHWRNYLPQVRGELTLFENFHSCFLVSRAVLRSSVPRSGQWLYHLF